MNIEEVEDWVHNIIPKWLLAEKNKPGQPFPVPPNPYIPLATT